MDLKDIKENEMSGGGPRPPGNGGSNKTSAAKPVKPKPNQVAEAKRKGKRA
jgi:hypothetical protein